MVLFLNYLTNIMRRFFDIVLGKGPYRFIVVLILSLTLGFVFNLLIRYISPLVASQGFNCA
ncbi:hypothetical protein B6I76_13540 [Klebsiella pneumoniae]|nr:hypothetical protein B6I39_23665 [Klebsiella quasipneumoniae]PLD58602.1 hypothetical protein B6I58_28445 [Klebsiella pneumoniae]PLE65656.1 hypothetical protein B6I76_13540 [Klebsiella pneumoniae]PLJ07034.1 hypothetical protein B6J59_27455 [Klebsiella pneumoniae]HBX7867776.1 hypothetical protein [Klebsiella pneumoniae]